MIFICCGEAARMGFIITDCPVGRYRCYRCGYTTKREWCLERHRNRKRPCDSRSDGAPVAQVRRASADEVAAAAARRDRDASACCGDCGKVLSCARSLARHRLGACRGLCASGGGPAAEPAEACPGPSEAAEKAGGARTYACGTCLREFRSRQARHAHCKRGCPCAEIPAAAVPQGAGPVAPALSAAGSVEDPEGTALEETVRFMPFQLERAGLSHGELTELVRSFHLRGDAASGFTSHGLLAFIDRVWFSPLRPHNHNARLRSPRSRFGEVWRGGRWELEDKWYIAQEMMSRAAADLYLHYTDNRTSDPEIAAEWRFGRARVTSLTDICQGECRPRVRKALMRRVVLLMARRTREVRVWATLDPVSKAQVARLVAAERRAGAMVGESVPVQISRFVDAAEREFEERALGAARRAVAEALAAGKAGGAGGAGVLAALARDLRLPGAARSSPAVLFCQTSI